MTEEKLKQAAFNYAISEQNRIQEEYKNNPDAEEDYDNGIAMKGFIAGYKTCEKENEKLNEKLSEIVECFVSRSYTDDFEMMNAGREIYEMFYPDKKSYRE